jgi:hypothetical protein
MDDPFAALAIGLAVIYGAAFYVVAYVLPVWCDAVAAAVVGLFG